MRSRCSLVTVHAILVLGAFACAQRDTPSEIAEPDAQRFATDVYPIMLRDCAMAECHGSPNRFFRILGPGRVRLSKSSKPLDPATDAEIMASYDRARSLIEAGSNASRSLLLRKPLAIAAGGANHEGTDSYSRNVYVANSDPSYAVIASWVLGHPAQSAP